MIICLVVGEFFCRKGIESLGVAEPWQLHIDFRFRPMETLHEETAASPGKTFDAEGQFPRVGEERYDVAQELDGRGAVWNVWQSQGMNGNGAA
jgi:hypothetical protein